MTRYTCTCTKIYRPIYPDIHEIGPHWAWHIFHLPCRAEYTDYVSCTSKMCTIEPMSPTETQLYQNVALSHSTETIVESWSCNNETKSGRPKNVQCVTLSQQIPSSKKKNMAIFPMDILIIAIIIRADFKYIKGT